MTLTNEQKADAVAEAHERLLVERPGWATLAEVLRVPVAEQILAEIDRGLERLAAEDARLKAERAGLSAMAESPEVMESERYRDAVDHTREIEDDFHQDLARMGHADDHTPAVRRQIEAKALAYIREAYGPAAAEHCRGLLAPEQPDSPLDGLRSIPYLPV